MGLMIQGSTFRLRSRSLPCLSGARAAGEKGPYTPTVTEGHDSPLRSRFRPTNGFSVRLCVLVPSD